MPITLEAIIKFIMTRTLGSVNPTDIKKFCYASSRNSLSGEDDLSYSLRIIFKDDFVDHYDGIKLQDGEINTFYTSTGYQVLEKYPEFVKSNSTIINVGLAMANNNQLLTVFFTNQNQFIILKNTHFHGIYKIEINNVKDITNIYLDLVENTIHFTFENGSVQIIDLVLDMKASKLRWIYEYLYTENARFNVSEFNIVPSNIFHNIIDE